MNESYEEHQKRINRERQQRFRLKNKEKIAEQRAKDREILRQYKEQHSPAPEPAVVPVVQPQPVVNTRNKTKTKTVKEKRTIFSQDVVIQKLKEYSGIKNENTRATYIRDAKALFRMTGCPDLEGCLKNFDKIKNEIETAKQIKDPTKLYDVNSKKQVFQSIVWLITHFEIHINPELKQKYKEIFEVYKVKSAEQREEKQGNESAGKGAVAPVNTILKTVEDKYGEDSKQFLIVSFYKNAPVRDNFAGLVVIPSIRKNDNTETNYVVVPRQENQKCTLVIQKYKTDKLYGILKFQLDERTSTLLRNYIKKKKVQYDGKLFPEYKKDSMSSYISNFMKTSGFTGEGGVNYIRHSIATEDFSKHNLTAEERVKLSNKLGHSVIANYNYVRKVAG